MTVELSFLSIAEASTLLRSRRLSPVELTRTCLDRIERLNPTLNAFITVMAEAALERARAAEEEIANGHYRGPLHGIPIALKDIVDTAGVRTTAASGVFADRVAVEDARVVTLLKEAGAVIVGKTNLHEFAYGGSGLISHFGPVRNPRDVTRVTGGSSSGSAAAVAGGMCLAAIGSDTAGSIRLPASYCGIVGHKPSYGLVSARGVVPLSWSFDHVGPMTRTVGDAATMLAVITGYDPLDLGSRRYPHIYSGDEAGPPAVKKFRVGVAREMFFESLDTAVDAAVDAGIRKAEEIAAEVREVKIPVDTDRTVHVAEAFTFHQPLLAERAPLYHPETLRRIRNGETATAAQYIAKLRELETLRRSADAVFCGVDVVLTPTVPILPPTFAELEAHPEQLRARELLMLRNTRPFNVLGTPAMSIPCGVANGLPIGLQIAARPGADALVLQFAAAMEDALGSFSFAR